LLGQLLEVDEGHTLSGSSAAWLGEGPRVFEGALWEKSCELKGRVLEIWGGRVERFLVVHARAAAAAHVQALIAANSSVLDACHVLECPVLPIR
jgi:hypothetical protein